MNEPTEAYADKPIGQETEEQCQECQWWLDRNGGNACFPRAITYIFSSVNETAMPAHKATFGDCPHRKVGGDTQ